MRVGFRVRQVCEFVETAGFCSVRHISICMLSDQKSAGTYLKRGVAMGLMKVDRKIRPHAFSVVQGWRESAGQNIGLRVFKKTQTNLNVSNERVVQHAIRNQPNSVFQLGTRNR